jgi:phosphogluconate dehydratase
MGAGLMHADVLTVRPGGLSEYTQVPQLQDGALRWQAVGASGDTQVLRPVSEPFSHSGGLRVLTGNLGRCVIKVSAVPEDRQVIEAPARVFDSQESMLEAFSAGELEQSCRENGAGGLVCVVRWQGPRANGMPELHKLTPPLAVLQGQGWRIALVTDGRMSGASGTVPAAIHVSPEAASGGALAKLRDGDRVRLDTIDGTLEAVVPPAEWAARVPAVMPLALHAANRVGLGRDLFAGYRRNALAAEEGACTWL